MAEAMVSIGRRPASVLLNHTVLLFAAWPRDWSSVVDRVVFGAAIRARGRAGTDLANHDGATARECYQRDDAICFTLRLAFRGRDHGSAWIREHSDSQ